MPFTTAFTRIQLDDKMKNAGPLQVMLRLVRDEGFLTLFRGCQSTLLRLYERTGQFRILLIFQCRRV